MRPLGIPATSILALLSLFISSTTGLYSLVNSPCAVQCGNVLGSTTGDDIVCPDSSYPASGSAGTSAGTTFQSCTSCQIGSTYVDPTTGQTDLQWGLYNLRYAISWCLFGFPNNTAVGDTPCITSTACGPLVSAFEFDNLSTTATAYGYCTDMNGIQIPKCGACLQEQSTEFYLKNFLTALTAACDQEPKAGTTISIQGSMFSTTAVNITTPSATPSGSAFGSGGGISLGAKVGIAVAGVVVILFTVGFCIVCLGRRRRRAALRARQRQSGYDQWQATQQFQSGNSGPLNAAGEGGVGGFFDSPQSQRPLNQNNWGIRPREDESPQSAAEKVYFSPYSSQFTSPVSAHDTPQTIAKEWPYPLDPVAGGTADRDWGMDTKRGMSGMRERSSSKEREGERIEMQNVGTAPVLSHPGRGRGGSLGLTEEDAKRGDAL